MKVTNRKIKEYSDQIIAACMYNGRRSNIDIDHIFHIMKPFVSMKTEFVSMGSSKTTKAHEIHSQSLGTLTFRIQKKLARKIGIYPFNRRTYRVTYKEFFKKNEVRSRTPHRIDNPAKTGLVKRTIHFSSVSHKDVKKFEFPKLLRWVYKLDREVFLKIEKVLFEKTG